MSLTPVRVSTAEAIARLARNTLKITGRLAPLRVLELLGVTVAFLAGASRSAAGYRAPDANVFVLLDLARALPVHDLRWCVGRVVLQRLKVEREPAELDALACEVGRIVCDGSHHVPSGFCRPGHEKPQRFANGDRRCLRRVRRAA